MQSLPKEKTDYLHNATPPAANHYTQHPIPTIQAVTRRRNWLVMPSFKDTLQYISRTKLVLILLWIWLLSWGEKNSFQSHIAKCRWESWEDWEPAADPHHLVLLADPQLVDPHTYPGRPWPLSTITIKHTDQYMRRSFEALDAQLDPASVFFLGDLFDGGREWTTGNTKSADRRWHKYGHEYWMGEYERFGKIYHEPWLRGSASSVHRNRKMIATIPGNHDLGLGHGIQVPVRNRFETYFGQGNRIDSVGNHTLVSIDSVSLSAKLQFEADNGVKPNSALWEPTEQFLADIQAHKIQVASRNLHIQTGKPENTLQNQTSLDMKYVPSKNQWKENNDERMAKTPTIILSHMPFWRAPDTPCGPLRERHPPVAGEAYDPDGKDPRNAIAVAYGYQYQNVLAKELSTEVVKLIGNVKHIFSGDDHDYCQVTHKDLDPKQSSIPEITVKSTSWAMGVRKPGFLLVSLWNPLDGAVAPHQTIQTHLCLLPDQLGIFIRYLQLILLSVAVLVVRTFVFRKSMLQRVGKEEALLPSPATTPTYPKQGSDFGSYSSSSSNGKSGLAARSSTGRGQSLTQANGHGYGNSLVSPSPSSSGFLSPARTYSPAYTDPNDQRWKSSSVSTRRSHTAWIARSTVRDFSASILQVASVALLWYWWLARTI